MAWPLALAAWNHPAEPSSRMWLVARLLLPRVLMSRRDPSQWSTECKSPNGGVRQNASHPMAGGERQNASHPMAAIVCSCVQELIGSWRLTSQANGDLGNKSSETRNACRRCCFVDSLLSNCNKKQKKNPQFPLKSARPGSPPPPRGCVSP